jgi:predicted RNase H-like HicB family nuclease
VGIASQGESIEESRANLVEAFTLFFETASPSKIARQAYYDGFINSSRGAGWVNFS